MLFITNRLPKGSWVTKIGREFIFDLRSNSPSASVYFCNYDENNKKSTELGSGEFLVRLSESEEENILFYIHGFHNTPEMVLNSAGRLSEQCKLLGQVLVIPVIWPCSAHFGIINKYYDDVASANHSSLAFSRALKIYQESQISVRKRTHVLAHSMGNRVLQHTLNEFSATNKSETVFENIFLVSADIAGDALEMGKAGEAICRMGERVIVYYAKDDRALNVSIYANFINERGFGKRLGDEGPSDLTRMLKHVYCFDCSSYNNAEENSLGHSYFISTRANNVTIVLRHILSCITHSDVVPSL